MSASGLMSSTNWTWASITQMPGPWTSRIWLTVSDMSPQKIDDCCAMRRAAKTTPKTMPRYLPRFPISIFQAIQNMPVVYRPRRET